jgi:hypothetical protein
MAILRAQAIFPFHTGIDRDVWTNSWHFDWDETGTFADAATEIGTRLDTFYTACYNGSNLPANYVQWTQASLEVLNLDDPSPRIPEVRAMGIGTTVAGSTIPTECAVVMTFAAAETGGVVRQRLYNRIYLGGLGNGWMQTSTASTFPELSDFGRDKVAGAATNLHDENDTVIDWIQYSPTASVARPITRGWIDNSPDTQRRRSVDATARTPITGF